MENSSTGTTSLIDRAQSLDPAAWHRLVNRFTPFVYSWCRHSGVKPDDAEDVMQDVFLVLGRRLPQIDNRGSGGFRSYLRKVTKRKVIDRSRKDVRSPPLVNIEQGLDALVMVENVADVEETELSIDKQILCHQIDEFIKNSFSKRDIKIFNRLVIDEHPPPLVAKELRVSVNVVYQVKSRMLGRIKDEFFFELED